MVEIIGPDRIASVSTLVAREEQLPLVSRVLTDHKRAERLNSFGDFLNQMLRRIIRDGVSRIEPETVDVKFVHPIYRIFREMIVGQALRPVASKLNAAPHGV